MSDSDLDEIHKQIEAVRARRPNGYATRCELCRFWETEGFDDRVPQEDQEGECHRYAPVISHRHTGLALGLIALAVEKLANIENDKYFDYEFDSQGSPFHGWQGTYAHDWCGEFKERS
jgi:hypothetical protein